MQILRTPLEISQDNGTSPLRFVMTVMGLFTILSLSNKTVYLHLLIKKAIPLETLCLKNN